MTTRRRTVTPTVRARRSGNAPAAAGHFPTNAHWIITQEIKVNGRNVEPGVEVKIAGESGRFIFRRHVLNPENGKEWIDVYGGAKGQETIRSFRPERIATVHRTRKTRKAQR